MMASAIEIELARRAAQIAGITGDNTVITPVQNSQTNFPVISPIPSLTSLGVIDTLPTATNTDPTVDEITATASPWDYRVRLRAISGQEEKIYGPISDSNILKPLHSTGGLLFPYTPTIQFTQDVDYKTLELTHSNGEQYAYSRTPSVSLSVTGKFAIQNPAEGRFVLAAIHFLRVASKMWFGAQSFGDTGNTGPAGTPPPILVFDGLGAYMFSNLKVILRSHSYSIDENAQLVRVPVAGTSVRLPSLFTLSMNLTVINTPTEMREDFNLDEFRTGALMTRGGWI
jgi:hypothetical protein